MTPQQIREAIEVCRPDRDDFDLPELAELASLLESDDETLRLFAATQVLDAEITDAFHDVPVPDGLCDRLLTGVAAASRETDPLESATDLAAKQVELRVTDRSHGRRSRRVIWIGLATLVAAASLAALIIRPWEPQFVPLAKLESDSKTWTERALTWPDEDWQRDAMPLQTYPLDPAIRARLVGWHPLPTEFDANAVAYDLASRGSGRALLFVSASENRFDLPAAPYRPLNISGAWTAGAWKSDSHLYVLAVRNSKIGDYLRQPSIAVVRPATSQFAVSFPRFADR